MRDLPESIVNSVARIVMRHWSPPPGLGFWGAKQWEAWILRDVCARVREGRIAFSKGFDGPRLTLRVLETVPQPAPTDDLLERWRVATGYE